MPGMKAGGLYLLVACTCWSGLKGGPAGHLSIGATCDQFDGEFGHGFPKKPILSTTDFLAADPATKECGLSAE